MSKNIKGNHKHLTLSDRIFIEQSLNDHMKFNAIAMVLEKDPSTISKEVVRSMDIKPIPHYKGNDCKFFDTCFESKLCASCCVELCKLCSQTTADGCVPIMNLQDVRELIRLHMSAMDVLILLTVDTPNNTTVLQKPSRNMSTSCLNPEKESTWNRKNFKNSMT